MDVRKAIKAPFLEANPSIAKNPMKSILPFQLRRNQSRNSQNVFFIICLLIICGITTYVGAVPTRVYGHDNFFLLENGWRIVCGQRPHLDFFSPWGPVMFLIVGLGLSLSNASANGVGYGNAIVGLVIGLWAFFLSRGRVTSIYRFVVGIYLTLLVTAPFALGDWPLSSSHATLYNRYGYALLGLLLVECFSAIEYVQRHDRHMFLGGISSGIILAIVLFLKASYFVIALPIIATSFLLLQSSRERGFGLLLGFFIVFFSMLAYLKFDIRTIVEAFYTAAVARSMSLNLSTLSVQLASQVPALIVLMGLLYFGSRRTRPLGSQLNDHHWALVAFIVFVSDSALMLSNAQVFAMPLLGVFAILVSQLINMERQSLQASHQGLSKLSYHGFILMLCALLIATQLVFDFAGLLNGLYQKVNPSPVMGPVKFSEPHVATMILYDGDLHKEANGSVYTNYVNDGVALLRKHCTNDDRILTMDMVNPFPYALKWQPPHGGIAAVAFNYTLSRDMRPSFDYYFGNATAVLVPKRPAQLPVFLNGFNDLYLPALTERYRLHAESEAFWLYKKK